MVNAEEALRIDRILEYSVFDNPAQKTSIAAKRLESYDNILMLGESDIVNLAKGLSDRNVAIGKISFGLR